ncbi:MAG: VWA domain-containing protein, partial [Firmicutes bacterium]|nr:VWA domain-containing protein [Bacillota bacterium]
MRTLYGSTSWRRVLALVLVFVMMVSTMGTSGYSVFADDLVETNEEVTVSEPEAVTPEVTVDDQGPSPGAEESEAVVDPATDAEPVEASEDGEEPAPDSELVETSEEGEEPTEEVAEPVEPTEEAIEDEEVEEPAEEVEEPVEPVEEAEGGEEAVTEDSSEPTLVLEASQIVAEDNGSECEAPEAVAEPSVISDTAQLILDALTQEGEAALEELSEEELLEEELLEEELLEEVEILTHYEAELDGVLVIVDVPEGAFTEPVELKVKKISERSRDFNDAEKVLEAEDISYDGIIAFDISFYAGAEPVEPDPSVGLVSVQMSVKTEILDTEDIDVESIQVTHISDEVVETVADTNPEEIGFVEISEAAINDEVVEAIVSEFDVESFSTFTITWRNNSRTVTVHYVDQNGNELTISNPDNTHQNLTAQSSSPAFLIYDIDGYEYDHTYRNSDTTGNRIAPILRKNNNNYWRYTTNLTGDNPTWTELSNNDNIYVVYKQKPAVTPGGTAVVNLDDETWPEGENAPAFSKSSVNNGNGTNTISLSIVGGEKPVEASTPADVIVVFDISGSMGYNMGDRTRLSRAQTATNTMAQTLLKNENVKMALITFSTDAEISQGFTDNYSTFSSKVNGLSAAGGTNWEKALKLANEMEVREDAATYVVFVTDGDPTFRMSRGDVRNSDLDVSSNNDYRFVRQNAVFGAGGSDAYGRNFDFAVDQVSAIAGAKKNFYAIGISNDVTKVQNLTTEGGVAADHAFIASDSDAMEAAFASITEAIKLSLGFGDVQITDGITELTNTEMKVMETVDPNSFQYYRWGGEGNKYGADEAHKTEWTTRAADGCAAATYDETEGAVHWDMGEGFQLESGVHYVVTFRVWPSQESYDLIAELNNGTKVYAEGQENSISAAERAQVVELSAPTSTTQGRYALKTNTDKVSATYSQTTKTGEIVTVSGERNVEATYEEGTIQSMNLESMLLTIKKEFEDDLTAGEDRETEVTLVLKRRNANQTPAAEFENYAVPQGGTTSANIVLNEANDWTYQLYVAPGVKVDGEVLEHGYDFTIVEPDIDYHYGLAEEIINPMVVDGEDTYYGDGQLLTGEEITTYIDRALTAVNRVKSGIDIQKIVYDVDGTTEIYPDTAFTIKGKLLGPDGQPYTWQEGDDVNASGAYHKYDKNGIRIIYKGHFADSSNIEFTLKAGERVRFINVPEGSTFEFEEVIAENSIYEWNSTEAVTQHRVSAGGEFTTEGDVQPEVSGGKASLNTGVVGNKQYSVTFNNKRAAKLPKIEIVKVDEDDNTLKLNGAEFALYTDQEKNEPVTKDANGNTINLTTGNKDDDSEGPDGWALIGMLAPGTYYLFETSAPDGYVQPEDTDSPIIITVTKGDTAVTVSANKDGMSVIEGPTDGVYTITAENKRDAGDLKITKTVEDGGPGYANKVFTFEITLKDAEGNNVDGTYEADGTATTVSFADGKATVTLKHNQSITIKSIPTGYSYKVVEVANQIPGGYSIKSSDNTEGAIEDDLTIAAFTNTYSVGSVEASFPVKKVLSVPDGMTGPESWEYTISVAAQNGAPAATTMSGKVNQDTDTVTFGPFTYTAPGTYTYTVSETGEIDGVANDENAAGKTVTVTVTDNKDGTLTATADSTANSP